MAGMSQGYGSGSTQATFLLGLPQTFSANTTVSLVDSAGTELFSHAPAKQFGSIVYSSPLLEQGGSYTLKVNGESVVTFTLTETPARISSDGTVSVYAGGEGFGMGGGRGGAGGDFAGAPEGAPPAGDWGSGTRPERGTAPEGGPRGGTPPATS
jgi:hypothetical protein